MFLTPWLLMITLNAVIMWRVHAAYSERASRLREPTRSLPSALAPSAGGHPSERQSTSFASLTTSALRKTARASWDDER